ncbi:hypothetical protein CHUAL_003503 [Chamberlinius hualienensis]
MLYPVVVVVLISFCTQTLIATANEDSKTTLQNENNEDNYRQYDLSVELYPLDRVDMLEGSVQEVQLVIQTNWTQFWQAGEAAIENITSLPLWIRCPGVIRITSDTPELLEVVNGTLNVTGADFLYTNHTVTLKSHHRGPAYQYLQVHWTSTVPVEECTFELLEEKFYSTLEPSDHTVLSEDDANQTDTTIHLLKTVDSNANANKPNNSDDLIIVDEVQDTAMSTEDLSVVPVELKAVNVNDKPVESTQMLNHFSHFQVFRRRRRDTQEWQDPAEKHHHHHYDETNVTIKVTEKPKPKTLADILLLDDYKVAVLRMPTTLDTVFVVFVTISVAFNTFMMGMQIDYKMVIQVFKKPIGPAVGFVSQFLFMPLASFGLAHLFFSDINLQLGLFTLGCSPGGNGSNFWTLMLKGDLNLSITMTFVSTTCAIFMMPFWLLTLGTHILKKGEIVIPLLNLFLSLISFTVPVILGVVVRIFKPKWAELGRKLIRPITVICIIVLNVLAIFNSLFIFRLMTWQTVVAGLCVAWGGYFFGGTLAYICRQERAQIIAISIETAIQNPGITFMVLRLTLEQPSADLSAVAPVSQMIVTSFPLMLLYGILATRRRIIECRKRRRGMQVDDPLPKDKAASKPFINNVTITPKVITNDERQTTSDTIQTSRPLSRPLSREINAVNRDNLQDNEHLYENYPPGPRILDEGETRL